MATFKRGAWVALGLAVAVASAGLGFHETGHQKATQLAITSVSGRLPAFLVEGAADVSQASGDPDLIRMRAVPQLRDAEYPEHFFDIELLGNDAWPETRYAFIVYCARRGLDPTKVGLLPYAIAEWTQRLTIAMAEHLKWPDNSAIQAKCLFIAGVLAHYAQDSCQPLHTTIHYDGRIGTDGTSPATGIHVRVDALLSKIPDPPGVGSVKAEPFEHLMPAIFAHIKQTHDLVDRVYAIEQALPKVEAPIAPNGPIADFARDRLAECVSFTASLYLTAWEDSKTIELPDWHRQ